jgi:hypothetical protein
MMFLMASTLAIGATAGWMLEQQYGAALVRWGQRQIERLRGTRF